MRGLWQEVEMTARKPTLADLAERISGYLPRLLDAYEPRAWAAGRYVMVKYKSFWGPSSLTKAEAEEYLAALDSGRLIRHYTLQHEKEAAK